MPSINLGWFLLQQKGKFLSNSELEGVDINTVDLPSNIHDFWKKINFRIPRNNFSDLELKVGDRFNGVLSKFSIKEGVRGDYRIVTLQNFSYAGYCKLDWETQSKDETLKERYLRVGLVYRFEVVFIKKRKRNNIFYARPLFLVVDDEEACKLNLRH